MACNSNFSASNKHLQHKGSLKIGEELVCNMWLPITYEENLRLMNSVTSLLVWQASEGTGSESKLRRKLKMNISTAKQSNLFTRKPSICP